MEDLLREHGANGTTLVVCLVAVWRTAHACLAAYADRTTAIREAVTAVESVSSKIQAVRIMVPPLGEKLQNLNSPM